MKARVALWLGMPGSGKSYNFAKEILTHERVILFDPICDKNLMGKGTPVKTWQSAVDAMKKNRSFFFHRMSAHIEELDYLAEIAMLLGNVTLAIDELSLFCTPNTIGPELAKALRLGRHKAVRVYGTSQRPYDLHSLFRSVTEEWNIFRTTLPRDVEYFRSFVPDAERVRTLEQISTTHTGTKCLVYSNGKVEIK